MQGLCLERFSGPFGFRRLSSSSVTTSPPPPSLSIDLAVESPEKRIGRMISENPVVIFSREGCCLCHVVKRLLAALGVHPIVVELDDVEAKAVTKSLRSGGSVPWGQIAPVVFVGGQPIGGVDSLMGLHLSGQLMPKLVESGALQM